MPLKPKPILGNLTLVEKLIVHSAAIMFGFYIFKHNFPKFSGLADARDAYQGWNMLVAVAASLNLAWARAGLLWPSLERPWSVAAWAGDIDIGCMTS